MILAKSEYDMQGAEKVHNFLSSKQPTIYHWAILFLLNEMYAIGN